MSLQVFFCKFFAIFILDVFDFFRNSMPPPIAKPKPKPKPKPPPVQSAGPGMMFSKKSFFLPNRGPGGGKVEIPKQIEALPTSNQQRFFQPQRRFIYDKVTGEAYAEWINEAAVCIHTGQELFRSRRYEGGGDDDGLGGHAGPDVEQRFDYSAPKQRHPNDYSVFTEDIIASGFITLDAFKAPDGAAVRLRDYEAFLQSQKECAARDADV